MIVERDRDTCQCCAISKSTKLSAEQIQGLRNMEEAAIMVNPFIYLFSKEDIEKADQDDPELGKKMRKIKIDNKAIGFTGYVATVSQPLLEVHHKAYIYGYLPWEYPDSWLETLCELCHHKKHFGDDHSPFDKRKIYKVLKSFPVLHR